MVFPPLRQPVPDDVILVGQATDTPIRGDEIKRHLEAGSASLRIADSIAATDAFQAVLALDSKHVGAMGGLANALNQQGRTEEAISTVRGALESAPRNAGLHVQLGQLLNRQGNAEAAVAAFQAALALDPRHAGALASLANVLGRQGRTEEAISIFHAALEVAPKNVGLHVQLGQLLNRKGDAEAAEAAFQAALAVDPKHAGALASLAGALHQQGRTEDAIAATLNAIEVTRNNSSLHVRLGQLYEAKNSLPEAAIAFRAALDIDASNSSALAGYLRTQNPGNQTMAAIHAAIANSPEDASLHTQLGQTLNQQRKWEAADVAFRAALALDPIHVGAMSGLATTLSKQGKGDEAIGFIRATIDVAPVIPGMHVRLGQLLEEHHRLADAAEAYRAALQLEPGNHMAKVGLRKVRDPATIFELFGSLLQSPQDKELLDQLAAELEATRDALVPYLQFAINPCESDIPSIAKTPFEQEILRAILRTSQRQSFRLEHGTTAPLKRMQIAPPETDTLAELTSHESWTPIQWLNSYLLRQTKPAHRSAVVVTIRDEGLYLLEWVAHYRVLGFDNIFVYSNDNIDDSEDLLHQLATHGIITLIHNQLDPNLRHGPQLKAYAHALHLLPELWEYEWVLFVDCDEFLIPDQSYNLQIGDLLDDALSKFPERPPSAICFNWFWCVSGVTYAYKPEMLLTRFPHGVGRGGMKSFVRLHDIFSMYRVHFPEIALDGFLVKSDFTPLNKATRWRKSDPVFGSARLNHYWNKSFEEYSVKKARGDATSVRGQIWKREFNTFFTTNEMESAENYAPPPEPLVAAVQAEIRTLSSLTGVAGHMAKIMVAFPRLLGRFDEEGGVSAIYEATQASISRSFRKGPIVDGEEGQTPGKPATETD